MSRRVRFLTRQNVANIVERLLEHQLRFDPEPPAGAFRLRGGETTGGALLDSALGEPQQSFGGHYLYVTIFDKAAALFRSLVKNHPFIDGNKRAALVCTVVFLRLNGYELAASQDEQIAFTLDTAAAPNVAVEDIARWIRRNSHKVP